MSCHASRTHLKVNAVYIGLRSGEQGNSEAFLRLNRSEIRDPQKEHGTLPRF